MGERKNSKKNDLSQFMLYTQEELEILSGKYNNKKIDIKEQENFVEKNLENLY